MPVLSFPLLHTFSTPKHFSFVRSPLSSPPEGRPLGEDRLAQYPSASSCPHLKQKIKKLVRGNENKASVCSDYSVNAQYFKVPPQVLILAPNTWINGTIIMPAATIAACTPKDTSYPLFSPHGYRKVSIRTIRESMGGHILVGSNWKVMSAKKNRTRTDSFTQLKSLR
jgi:hypothetical protein